MSSWIFRSCASARTRHEDGAWPSKLFVQNPVNVTRGFPEQVGTLIGPVQFRLVFSLLHSFSDFPSYRGLVGTAKAPPKRECCDREQIVRRGTLSARTHPQGALVGMAGIPHGRRDIRGRPPALPPRSNAGSADGPSTRAKGSRSRRACLARQNRQIPSPSTPI
jgi:hypothetical protein